MSKKAMKLALEALGLLVEERSSEAMDDGYEAIKALEEALAKQEQGEPVGFIADRYNGKMSGSAYPEPMAIWINQLPPIGSVLYTTPQQRKPLTEERIDEIWNQYCDGEGFVSFRNAYKISSSIEAAHDIKE